MEYYGISILWKYMENLHYMELYDSWRMISHNDWLVTLVNK